MDKKIIEVDIAERISERGGEGFLIDLGDTLSINKNKRLLIRNGIAFILCKSGDSSIMVDEKEYSLYQNNVIVLPENHIIDINPTLLEQRCIIATTTDYILNMPSPIDTNIFNYSRYLSVIKVSDEKFEDLMSYYRFINKENKENGKYKSEIIHSIFYALILEIIGEYEKIFSTEDCEIKADNLSDRFFKLLTIHYKQYRSVQFYAEKLNLTPKYLSTAIKRITGRPILEWIHEAVLIDAKMLLRTTDLTVQQISEQLNFSSSSAFVQFFKKHTGTTPLSHSEHRLPSSITTRG